MANTTSHLSFLPRAASPFTVCAGALSLLCLTQCLSVGSDSNAPASTDDVVESTTGNPVVGTTTAVDSNTTTIDPTRPVVPTEPYTGPLITKVGRFDTSNPNVIRYGYQGSRLGVSFTGTSLGVTLADTGNDDFDLFIDGNRYALDPNNAAAGCQPIADSLSFEASNSWGACLHTSLSSSPITTVLAKNLTGATHTAWFTKRTENRKTDNSVTPNRVTGSTAFRNFVLDPGATFLKPPQAKTRRLLFSADSGFTGLGAAWLQTQSQAAACGYISINQEEYLSIPAFTGRILDADVINVACSGAGIYDSVLDSDPTHTLPRMFEETFTYNSASTWDFSGDRMDAVIIGGGGLDLWGDVGRGVLRDPNAFVAAYAGWMARIREVYPDAFIVGLFTPSAQGNDIVTLRDAILKAMAIRQAAGDKNVSYFWYFQDDPNGFTNYNQIAAAQNLGYACSGHPSGPAAQVFATRLAAFIKQKKGW